jgi:hypothetical protein
MHTTSYATQLADAATRRITSPKDRDVANMTDAYDSSRRLRRAVESAVRPGRGPGRQSCLEPCSGAIHSCLDVRASSVNEDHSRTAKHGAYRAATPIGRIATVFSRQLNVDRHNALHFAGRTHFKLKPTFAL